MTNEQEFNPELINPNAPQRVPGPSVILTQPMPATKHPAGFKHYHCSQSAGSFFRTDGKKIPFVGHICSTDLLYDIAYLDNEINAGNPYLRLANKDEVNAYNFKIDPRGTIRKEVESETREKLEADIRSSIYADLAKQGIVIPKAEVGIGSVEATKLDGAKIESIDKLDSLKKLQGAFGKSVTEEVKTQGATVTMMNSHPAPLGGIVNTSQGVGADSNSK